MRRVRLWLWRVCGEQRELSARGSAAFHVVLLGLISLNKTSAFHVLLARLSLN